MKKLGIIFFVFFLSFKAHASSDSCLVPYVDRPLVNYVVVETVFTIMTTLSHAYSGDVLIGMHEKTWIVLASLSHAAGVTVQTVFILMVQNVFTPMPYEQFAAQMNGAEWGEGGVRARLSSLKRLCSCYSSISRI